MYSSLEEKADDLFCEELLQKSLQDPDYGQTLTEEEALKELGFCPDDFPAVREVPNAETLEAIAEVEEMRKHPERYKAYTDVTEMIKAILSEDSPGGTGAAPN